MEENTYRQRRDYNTCIKGDNQIENSDGIYDSLLMFRGLPTRILRRLYLVVHNVCHVKTTLCDDFSSQGLWRSLLNDELIPQRWFKCDGSVKLTDKVLPGWL